MKLAIIGSRNCPKIDIGAYIEEMPTEVVSGGAKGADSLAREWALENGIALKEFLIERKRGGAFIRNRKIAEYCDEVLAFWDGESHGTKYTIDYAKKLGKRVRVVMFS